MQVAMSALASEYCSASWAMSTPRAAQCSAAWRQMARTSGVALCQGGNVALVSSRAENGAAFMMPTPFALQIGHQVGKHRVLQRVVVVRQDHVQVGAVEDVAEDVHRIAADADEAHLALLLDLAQGRQRLLDDLRAMSTNSMSWHSMMSR